MDSQVKTWLYDILQSIEEIESYFGNGPKLFENFTSDNKTKRAVERNLEIIGEAVNRIKKRDTSVTIEHSQKIIATRNHIIHGYDKVSDDMIWSIIINHLPKLKTEVQQMINE